LNPLSAGGPPIPIDPFFLPSPTKLLVTIASVNKRILISLWITSTLLAGCVEIGAAVETPAFITSTLPPINTPLPVITQIPSAALEVTPTPPPAQPPVEAVTTTQLNLRSEPSTAGDSMGTVAAFSTIQVTGRESFGKWYQILDPAAGKGWIISSYVQIKGTGEIPIIDLGPSGLVIQGVNVRNGPSRNDASLGTLVANDVIALTAKDSSGEWLQVNFKGGSGWVSSEFMQVEKAESLPVIADSKEPGSSSEPEEPGNSPPVSIQDNDSLEAPIISVVLSSAGAGGLQSSGHVSLPLDEADWVQFTTPNNRISVQVKCDPEQQQVDLYQEGVLVTEGLLKCNEIKILNIEPGRPYTLKLHANAEAFNPLPYSVLINIVR
jgi:uncharacterized protein YraI